MITPAPTSKIDPGLARGIHGGVSVATATKPEIVKVTFPGTNYELHLRPIGAISAEVGKRVIGEIRAKARRVDVVQTGGRYIEPVYGRPRRVQGVVVSTTPPQPLDGESLARPAGGFITVNAGVPIVCELTDPRQSAADFSPGAFVSFDVLDGATFEERRGQ